ncbi:BMC domain-containing protein [bacterium]|nr:BMC domain-containing protein [bacterium]
MSGQAIGFIETLGLIPAIEGADTMLKTSNIVLIGKEYPDAGLVTVYVSGEVAAVQTAVSAGVAAASKLGKVVSSHVIPRPFENIVDLLLDKPKKKNENLESLNVKELRTLARTVKDFHLKGREISNASKEELLILLKQK